MANVEWATNRKYIPITRDKKAQTGQFTWQECWDKLNVRWVVGLEAP